MKKVLIALFAVILLLQSISVVAEEYAAPDSFDPLTEEQLRPYFNLITDTIESYHRLKRISVEADLDSISSKYANAEIERLSLSTVLKGYLKSKLVYDTSYHRATGLKEEYIDGTYTVLDWKTADNILVCKVACHLELQYFGASERSYFGECVQIAIQDPSNPVIVDWYNDDPASFESVVRGGGLDLFDLQNLITNLEIEELYTSIDRVLTQTEISMQNVYDESQIEYFSIRDTSSAPLVGEPRLETTSISFENWMDCGYPNFGHTTLVTRIDSTDGTISVSWRTSATSYGYNCALGSRYVPAPNTTNNTGGHIYRFIKLKYPF